MSECTQTLLLCAMNGALPHKEGCSDLLPNHGCFGLHRRSGTIHGVGSAFKHNTGMH